MFNPGSDHRGTTSPNNRPSTGASNLGSALSPPVPGAARPAPAAAPPGQAPPQGLNNGVGNMKGVDMTVPGANEDFYSQVKNRYTDPGLGVQWWNQNKNAFAAPGTGENYASEAMKRFGDGANTPEVSNNAQSWFDQYQGQMPHLAENAGLQPYYDNAESQATGKINADMAARGLAGSTAAGGMVSSAVGNLEADRAKNEAQYALQRTAEDRNWQQLGGNMASSADASSQMGSQNKLNWTTGLGDLALSGQQAGQGRINSSLAAALGIDASDISRLNSGVQASSAAQGAQTTRGQNAFMNQMTIAQALSGLMGNSFNGMFGQDSNLLDSSLGTFAGKNAEDSAEVQRRQEAQWSDLERAEGLTTGAMAMKGPKKG